MLVFSRGWSYRVMSLANHGFVHKCGRGANDGHFNFSDDKNAGMY